MGKKSPLKARKSYREVTDAAVYRADNPILTLGHEGPQLQAA